MKRYSSHLLGSFAFILISLTSSCQSKDQSNMSFSAADVLKIDSTMLSNAYEKFLETSLQYRRFKHQDLEKLLMKHQQKDILDVQVLGQSVLGKNIYRLDYGKGSKKVMLWSQMHGNEATATLALLDIFNFLDGDDETFNSIRTLLKEKTTLHFIPMLNPDGADKFVRRNALDIDLNRDARMGGTTEGNLLIQEAQRIKPDFGFNLHDQNIYYNVPGTSTPVTIALLAPAYNVEREVNPVRSRAMKLAAGMNQLLQQVIPGAVARYDDEHSPRGFGDNFQSWGASTVLIESGGYKGDPEKQIIRKLNFMIILNALIEIAQDTFEQHSEDQYNSIPFNSSNLTDVLLRGIRIKQDSVDFVADISIRRTEINQNRDYYIRSSIDDLGDLQDLYGYDEAGKRSKNSIESDSPLDLIAGQTYPQKIQKLEDLTDTKVLDLLRKGYTSIQIAQLPEKRIHSWPLIIFHGNSGPKRHSVRLGSEATFLLKNNQGIQYALVNGYLIDLSKDLTEQFGNPGQRHIQNWIGK